jgi:hypothetical protein
VTRLGAGGMPFLLPLLYQVGLGYTPVQSGLLIMPQFLAAISLKFTIPAVLTRLGYRRVLGINTLLMGLVIGLFAVIGNATPIWVIALQAVAFGYVASLQYTSMNTLVYADLDERDTSMGSSIASTIELRCRGGLVGHHGVRARSFPGHPLGDDVGHPQGVRGAWPAHGRLRAHLP